MSNLIEIKPKFLRKLIDLQYLTLLGPFKNELSNLELDKNSLVLDYGSGSEGFKSYFSSKNYTSYDPYSERSSIRNIQDLSGLKFKLILCFEVLEHVESLEKVVAHLHSLMDESSTLFVSMPFSARVHPCPEDYRRLTPAGADLAFKDFEIVSFHKRGSNFSTICNKIFYLAFYFLKRPLLFPFLIILIPFIPLLLLLAHLDLLLFKSWGDDQLGYFWVLKKK
ncbi:class I SAM-dependent methyltransferase [bacterium]|nr:class I SAM-dependent methyltransferase [bacterium]